NDALNPLVPHLSALPDYRISLAGHSVSLVQRGVIWGLLPVVALVNVVRGVRQRRLMTAVERSEAPLWTALAFGFVVDGGVGVGLSLVFAAGALLVWATKLVIDTLVGLSVLLLLGELGPGREA